MSTSGNPQGNNPVAQNTHDDRLNSVIETIDKINKDFRNQDVEFTLSDLRDLWDECITIAIVIPTDDAAQDRLIDELECRLGNRGKLHPHATYKGDPLSKRYPLLAEDVLNATMEAMKDKENINEDTLGLAAFAARIMGTAEHDPSELLFCALVVLRETLETQRRLNVKEEGTETPVADLLPAAVRWFKIAGWKLAEYCHHSITGHRDKKDEREDMIIKIGILAEGGRVPEHGITPERWQFWEERLEQLSSVEDEEISEQALKGKDFMREAWRETAK